MLVVSPHQCFSSFLIDLYPAASCAYSLRKLSYSTQAVVRVRRSSDDTEADFTANDITSGALTTWVGNNDGFIRTWYDQSVHGRHASQTTTSLQPQIVDNGALVVDGAGKPTLLFEQSKLIGQTLSGVSFFVVMRYKDGANIHNSISTRVNSNAGFSMDNQLNVSRFRAYGTISQITINPFNIYGTTRSLSEIIFEDGNFRGWVNNTSISSNNTTIGYVSESSQALNIGGRTGASGGVDMSGEISEVIIYPTNISSNRVAIQSNINSYYNLF